MSGCLSPRNSFCTQRRHKVWRTLHGRGERASHFQRVRHLPPRGRKESFLMRSAGLQMPPSTASCERGFSSGCQAGATAACTAERLAASETPRLTQPACGDHGGVASREIWVELCSIVGRAARCSADTTCEACGRCVLLRAAPLELPGGWRRRGDARSRDAILYFSHP